MVESLPVSGTIPLRASCLGCLGATALLVLASGAVAEQGHYYRFSPSKGEDVASTPAPSSNSAIAITAQPAGFASVPGEDIASVPPLLANALAPVVHALTSTVGDITASLPGKCPGLAFDTGQGVVSGTPVDGCRLDGLRVVSTDAAGNKATSQPFAISISPAEVTVSQGAGTLAEGEVLTRQAATNIPSATWSVSGAPYGSSASITPSGLLTVYATDIVGSSSYTLTLTASGKSVSRSSSFTYGVTPQTAEITANPKVRAGQSFSLQAGTSAPYPGEWMADASSGDLALRFSDPNRQQVTVKGTAPASYGPESQVRMVGAAFVATGVPSGAVPASAAAQSTLTVYPTLRISDVEDAYAVTEGQQIKIAPSVSPGAFMGQAAWSKDGLPAAVAQDGATGGLSGIIPGGAAAGSPYSARLVVTDSGDPGPGSEAVRSFQLTVSGATLLAAVPANLAVTDRVLPEAGSCTPLKVTNNGSLAAASLAFTVAPGGDFEACVPASTESPNCGTTLAFQQACQFGVRLIAQTNGDKAGTSTVTASNGASVVVPLTGKVTGGGLYAFTGFTFSNCGATGRFGPDAAACARAYSGTAWTQDTAFLGQAAPGIQLWTVPKTGSYRITARGAQGGSTATVGGGLGRVLRGTFALRQGDRIKILVGHKGGDVVDNGYDDAAGGGGTFVTTEGNTPLIVAGAGSGAGYGGQAGPSSSSRYGIQGYGATGTTTGGTSGSGSAGGTNGGAGVSTQYACSGAGLTGDGYRVSPASYDCSPLSFVNGGTGGNYSGPTYRIVGGFGGGAGVYGGGSLGTGAGGGYSGGGAGRAEGPPRNISGGGGSFNAGTSPSDSGATNAGHGSVLVEPL